MSRRLPPSQRPDRRPLSHGELIRIVPLCEPMLRERWAHSRHPESDILVLTHMDRQECAEMAIQQFGREEAMRVAEESRRSCGHSFVAYLQPAAFVDHLGRGGDPSHRAAAAELRGFGGLRAMGVVPLLVVQPGGLWATSWTKPGGDMMMIRIVPDPPVEAN